MKLWAVLLSLIQMPGREWTSLSNQVKAKQRPRPNTKYQPVKKQSNKSLLVLTLAIVAVIVVIILGINHQSNQQAELSNKVYDIDLTGMPVKGNADAPVKIVEFGDYKCPICQYFAQNVEPQIEKDFIDTGKAALYFANYTFIGPDSVTAALAAESVQQQSNDAFWPYYKAIYDNQQDEKINWATSDYLVQLAKDANLSIDFDKLKKDIDDKTYQSEVNKDNAMVGPLNVTGTPTLFINGVQYAGNLDYASIKAAIDEAVNKE
jgi:protein-disulfide isomerase